MEKPKILRIARIIDEGKDLKTFVFEHKLYAKPGQFVILWLPGVDEKPFSISYLDENKFAITIFKVGNFTEHMFKLKSGDKVGVRGPYGSSYNFESKRKIILVGGGCGTASLAYLANAAKSQGLHVDFIIGARSCSYLLYQKRMEQAKVPIFICTDDGSCGIKAFTTQVLEDRLSKKKYDCVYACGPEIMLKKVIEVTDKFDVKCQVSLERYMKCGFGLCGQCCIDESGARVCTEGPVFDKEKVRSFKEFANYKRDASGKRVNMGGKNVAADKRC